MTRGAFLVYSSLRSMMGALDMAYHAIPVQIDTDLPLLACDLVTGYAFPSEGILGAVMCVDH